MGPLSRCLSILTYHRVLDEPDVLMPSETCAREFDWHLELLTRWFNVVPLGEAVARLRSGTLPRRAACVTFDDGYANNATTALPILQRRGIPATFFVATGFLGGGRMWNDVVIDTVRAARGEFIDARCIGMEKFDISTTQLRRIAIARLLSALKYLPLEKRQVSAEALRDEARVAPGAGHMMSVEQVRQLYRSGMEIGAHTVNHPILARLDAEAASAEIRHSKTGLEAMTGANVALFAYPNGKPGRDYHREHVDIVRKLGFIAAVCTAPGVATRASDPYQLPRFRPWDRTPGRFLLRLLQNTFRTSPSLA